ncbi:MAG: TRAP transporter substrate-binding protein [Balneolales bacterium]|nr:TRAP transporter substrate-binding protein [Balneolales bacterium]
MKSQLVLILFCTLLLSCSPKQENKTLRLAHALDVNHSVHKAMVFMGEELETLSSGKLKIQIYPSQQLGAERELLELLQLGSIDITKTSAAVVESFSPEFRIFSLPYLFRDNDHMLAVLNGEIGERLLTSSTRFRFRGLSYYDSGKRSFYTKERRVETPADLEGLKIRVQASNTAIQMVNNYNAAATPIPFGELYSALQQGVVDGAENNPPSFYLTRHYEVCKYYVLNEHTSVPDVLMISEVTWQKLSEQEREWVKEAAERSKEYQFELWKESEMEALKAVEEAGVEIIYPDKTPFIEAAKPLVEQFLQDPQLRSLYNEIQELE